MGLEGREFLTGKHEADEEHEMKEGANYLILRKGRLSRLKNHP
jgi:hypothetical protein